MDPRSSDGPGTLEPPGPSSIRVEIDADQAGRIDKALSLSLRDLAPDLSRTRLQQLIVAGHVTIDGRAILDPGTKVAGGAAVVVVRPDLADAVPQPQSIPLAIVFEDTHLLVLDKPPGLVVHPAAGHADGTLVNALLAHCADSLSGIGGVRRPGIVHRLDKDTSGLMVVAKSDAAHRGLAEIFADHGRSGSLVRDYSALVWGVPDRKIGRIDAPLGRHAQHRDRIAIQRPGHGRHAVTHWTLERNFTTTASLLRCRLETGRTHQIRVHLASIGHPVLADPVYGTGFRTKAQRLSPAARAAVESLGRQALHASVLGFDHPISGTTMRFESALPTDLAGLVAALDRMRATGQDAL